MPEHGDNRVYVLLSDLFVDTEFETTDAQYLAEAIRPINVPIADIEHKIRAHLFPVLYTNLVGATGQWAGFDEDWLLREIQHAREKEASYFHHVWVNIWWYICGGTIISRWAMVKGHLQSVETSGHEGNKA